MANEYPDRPMMPSVARYACMFFGLANIIGTIGAAPADPVMLIGGLLVGGVWFGFGWYGGYPLVDTVDNWHPAMSPNVIEEMHRQGLLVMRRRQRMTWLVIPILFAVTLLVMPALMQWGHPEFLFLPLALSFAYVNCRYYGSRCPRCGYGFFTQSASRAAKVRQGNSCGHCGLSLQAYKTSAG